jgi:hypothetical protein
MLNVLGILGRLVRIEELVAWQYETHYDIGQVVFEQDVMIFGPKRDQAESLQHQTQQMLKHKKSTNNEFNLTVIIYIDSS